MKKVELLSPAGDIETLKIAVNCGADAVYISGKDYGARKYAPNFTIEEIEEATKYCHLYDVKIYITVNTLIEEIDIKKVEDYIRKLCEIGVDALIMQDIGLIKYIKEKFPNIEIHASTQTHNCSNECIKYLESLDVSRVVLARELTINEIEKIKTPLEIEVFIHGALCVGYSGQCLISSHLYNRSGNKGACSQVCRFMFDIYKNDEKQNMKDKYCLSMKELCVGDKIKNLLDLKVSSLKIEGRLKSKYYVGFVTKLYRTLIDKYYKNENLIISEDEYEKLLSLYNRKFTEGFLNGDKNIVNPKTCNHQGVYLGKVIESSKKIKIKLSKDLNQGDGIRFENNEGMIVNYLYNEKGLLTNKVEKNNIAYIDNKTKQKVKGDIYKTYDVELNKEVLNYPSKKIPVIFKVTAKKGDNLSVSILDKDIAITKTHNKVEKAQKKPTTKNEITEKLSKLGNTPFSIKNIIFEIDDDIFIPMKNINNLKQNLIEELIIAKQKSNKELKEKTIKEENKANEITNEISFLTRNEAQLKYLLTKNVNIYTENYELYKKYKNDKVYYRNPRASFNYKKAENTVTTNNGGLVFYKGKKVVDIYMNVKNSLTLNEFSKYSYKVGLSPELKDYEIKELMDTYQNKKQSKPNVEILIYGNLELMIMKYCPINYMLTKEKNKETCRMCDQNSYYLSNDKDHKYLLLKDEDHKQRLMSSDKIDKIDQIKYYKELGITNFRIDLINEDISQIDQILNRIKNQGGYYDKS